MIDLNFFYLIPIFLYAETHYKFRYFFSLLRKDEPEIITDAPHRLEPQKPLPILVIVKDAHLFPIQLKELSVLIKRDNKILDKRILLKDCISINQKVWWQIFEVDINNIQGNIEFDLVFKIIRNGKEKIYRNDNYRTSSHKPLKVYVAKEPLPKLPNIYLGECHSHSIYTEDQVEFGAPLKPSIILSEKIGLSFFCVTDHSYDLDDSLDNYLINDEQLPKWNNQLKEVEYLNKCSADFVILQGEEVTCRNHQNENVHLLLFDNQKFFNGTGDSAEKWFKTYSENSIKDVLDEKEEQTIAFAAHPKEPISFLQQLLLNRGNWDKKDIEHKKLLGIQFANGYLSKGFWRGYHLWIDSLIQGYRMLTIAGDDAHGNFNRFRQIGIPFIKIRESQNQLFGKMRTGVFVEYFSKEALLKAIAEGAFIITDGPVVNIKKALSEEEITSIGKTYPAGEYDFEITIKSSFEFGSIDFCKIFIGFIGKNEEILLMNKFNNSYSEYIKINVKYNCNYYIRAEAWTSKINSNDLEKHFCFTNPIWFAGS